MKNQYFKIIKNEDEQLSVVHFYKDIDIWAFICHKYLDTIEYAEQSHKDPYGSIYRLDLKEYLKNDFPDEYSILKKTIELLENNIEDNNIKIYLGTTYDYRQVNEEFDNEMKFLEYINSEIGEGDKHRIITEDILKDNGFEYNKEESELCRPTYLNQFGIKDYSSYRLWTDEKNPIKLDIDNGWNNSGRKWSLHIDNDACETIGYADIDTVWQFNTLMEVFGSKFRLK